ncbi:hypothetical protein U9M48_023650 [Paspalum notatum var. saurae]|uniref:Uncharacterized protein n=1 Tax=Paspalum notatum var. saurae TaxID=547442 RepID=A0AAQ3WVA7_PASNO
MQRMMPRDFDKYNMLRHAKKAFSKARSRSKGSNGGSSSVGNIFQGTVQSRQRQRQLLGCMEECAQKQAEEQQAEEQQAKFEEQAEEQQAEGQMEVNAEEEARADAELATSHAANPMMDGVETGGSSSGGTIRSWREVGQSRVGHRTPRPTSGHIGGSRNMWKDRLRMWVEASARALCGKERYRLDCEGDYEKEKMAKRVFQKASTKVVRDYFSNARI